MRFLIISAAMAAVLCAPANAETYIGLEGQLSNIDWASGGADKAGHVGGLALRVGYRTGRYAVEIGGETGANDYGDITRNSVNSVGHLSLNTAAADGFVYFPMFSEWFQPFVTAGVGYSRAKDRTISKWDTSELKVGSATEYDTIHHKQVTTLYSGGDVLWRAGAGIEARLSKDFSVRLTGRYQPYDFGGLAERGMSFNLGFLARI